MRLADLPAPETIRAGGEALEVRRLGAGRRVVLLHGGPGLDHHLLLPLAVCLAGRFEVLLPDLPGHGSGVGASPGLRQSIERLGRFLGALDAEAIGGHSLGAFFARELLRLRLVRPKAAVLLCPPGPLRGPDARRILAARQAALAATPREALFDEVAAGRGVSPLMREAIDATTIRSPAVHARLLAELQPLIRAAVPPCDPRCPVLVVGGALDPVAPPQVVQAVAAATRGAAPLVLPGAGHFPWALDAERVAAPIVRFLEGAID